MMNPRAREKIMLVIIFLILCAVRFLRTRIFMLYLSNIKKKWVRKISSNRYTLKASNVRPSSIPNKMKKNILRTIAKSIESIDKGRK